MLHCLMSERKKENNAAILRYSTNQGVKNVSDSYEEIKAIIKDLLGVDEEKITAEARFREDLEADSLDLVELIMAFEDKFGAEISDEDAQKILTVGEAISYINANKRLHEDSTTDAPPPKKR